MPRINVKLGNRSYPVIIGTNITPQLDALLKKHVGRGRLFVFCDAGFYALHGPRLRRGIHLPDSRVTEAVIPQGERSKSFTQLHRLYDFLLSESICRSDFILACGGGVTTDLVGYAAATMLRGVKWAAVPTTLVGMVDAAIGGKTAVNHNRGKNLIGSVHQPRFVFADTQYLATLSERQLIAGLGEVIKCAGLIGPDAIGKVSRYFQTGDLYDLKRLTPIVTDCAKYKAEIVGRDETEQHERMFLNYGHTIGHGVELSLGYGRILHGEAVIIGLLAALELGERVLPKSTASLRQYRELVERALTAVPKRKLDARAILDGLKFDKKRRHGRSTFVLLAKPGKPILTQQIDTSTVRKTLTATIALYSRKKGSHGKNPDR